LWPSSPESLPKPFGKRLEVEFRRSDGRVFPAEIVLTRVELGATPFYAAWVRDVSRDKARDAELRDAVLVTLGKKTVDQLADMTQRDSIKVQLTKAAGTLFKKGAVKRIYFPQFVIQ